MHERGKGGEIVYGANVGGLLQNRPLIGRGAHIREFGNHSKVYKMIDQPLATALHPASDGVASVILKNHSKLWITGGHLGYAMSNTTFISLDKPRVKGPNLPFRVSGHCMVQVDEKNIYLIGGLQNYTYSNKTWIIDPTNNFNVKEGPTMNFQKHNGSCATMTLNQEVYIVVFGAGIDAGIPTEATVEILNTVSPHNGWEMGMYYKGQNYLLLSISKES